MQSTRQEHHALTTYATEAALVDDFVALLGGENPWGKLIVGLEFDYQGGRTDVVAVSANGFVVAFEAKLERWRDALNQAYRNTCFAHRSYIVVPSETACRAARYEREFLRRKVGLCCLKNGILEVLFEPAQVSPTLPWLSDRVTTFARTTSTRDIARRS